MYSWVHIEDVCRVVEWMHDHKELEGTFNCAAPNPVTNSFFMKTLRHSTGHGIGLPAFEWMLTIGAFLIGTEKELLLKSRWVLPTKLQQAGFVFRYDTLAKAITAIVNNTPPQQYHLFKTKAIAGHLSGCSRKLQTDAAEA